MSRVLPDRAHPDFYKNEAKALLKTWRELGGGPAEPSLAKAQLAVARDHGFPSWPKFIAAVLERASDAAMRDEFFAAIAEGRVARAEALLDRLPALANAEAKDGARALHVGAESDDPMVARLLLRHGADLDATYASSAHNALSWAVTCNSLKYARELRDGGCPADLFCAAGLGDLDAVRTFWRDGALVPDASVTGSSRVTADRQPLPRPPVAPADVVSDALYVACRNGHADVAAFLLERGADPGFRAYLGATCFHWAHFGGDERTIALLARAGGDEATKDYYYGATPRAFAVVVPAAWGFPHLVRRALARDPSLANATADTGSAMQQAARRGFAPIVTMLLEAGADRAPLEEIFVQACVDGEAKLVHWLLVADAALANARGQVHPDHRAFMQRENAADGWTALHLAAHYGRIDVVRKLLDTGADVHAVARNGIGNTPLMAAIAGGSAEIVELLLSRGADPSARDASGHDAAALAKAEGRERIAAVLARHGRG